MIEEQRYVGHVLDDPAFRAADARARHEADLAELRLRQGMAVPHVPKALWRRIQTYRRMTRP